MYLPIMFGHDYCLIKSSCRNLVNNCLVASHFRTLLAMDVSILSTYFLSISFIVETWSLEMSNNARIIAMI